MRTLHADLTTAQQSATRTPYMRLEFRSRNRITTRTYTTNDGVNRIVEVAMAEGRFNGALVSPGLPYPISALVRLQDHDSTLNALEWRGMRLDIGWGFNTASGFRYSEGPPQFVARQRAVSAEGQMYLELHCISLWDYVRLLWVNQTSGDRFEWNTVVKDTSVRHIMMELLGRSKLVAAVLEDFGAPSVYTSYTTASINVTADDVPLLPASPAVNDAFYFGFGSPFDGLSVNLTTPGVGSWATDREYWNGTAWTALQGQADNTNNWTVGQLKTVKFDRPIDWATRNMNAVDPVFPNQALYYVRVKINLFTSMTTQPKATMVTVGQDIAIALDTSAAGQGDDYKPVYVSQIDQNIADVVDGVLGTTRIGIVCQKDGFHLKFIDNAQASPDYTYDTAHAFRVDVLEKVSLIPNKFKYLDKPPKTVGLIEGTNQDQTSIDQIGEFVAITVDPSIAAQADADEQALRAVDRAKRDRVQGLIEVEMNVGQEVWDLVRVIDSRTGATLEGRVSRLLRTYEPLAGRYRLEVTMGGVEEIERTVPLHIRTVTPFQSTTLYTPSPVGTSNQPGTGHLGLPFDHVHDWTGISVRQSSGAFQTARRRLNFLTATGMVFVVFTDLVDDETEVTVDWPGMEHFENGVTKSTRRRVNFIPGSGMTVTVVDNVGSGRADVTLAATAGGAPSDAQYVVLALNATLSAERVLQVAQALSLSDAGPNGNVTLSTVSSPAGSTVLVGTGRLIDTTGKLSGGGDLSVNRTLSWDGLDVASAGTLVGTRRRINFTASGGIVVTVTDDAVTPEVDINVGASFGAPVNIGTANSSGASTDHNRADHVHNHPDMGDLHTGYLLASGARDMNGNFQPNADVTRDFGSSVRQWLNIYSRDVFVAPATSGDGIKTPSGDLLLAPTFNIRSFGHVLPSNSTGGDSHNVWNLGALANKWATIYAVSTSFGDVVLQGYALAETPEGLFVFNHICPGDHQNCRYLRDDAIAVFGRDGNLYLRGVVRPMALVGEMPTPPQHQPRSK